MVLGMLHQGIIAVEHHVVFASDRLVLVDCIFFQTDPPETANCEGLVVVCLPKAHCLSTQLSTSASAGHP